MTRAHSMHKNSLLLRRSVFYIVFNLLQASICEHYQLWIICTIYGLKIVGSGTIKKTNLPTDSAEDPQLF